MSEIFAKHLTDIRRRLMWPDRQTLDDGPLAEYCVETIDELVTSLNLTNEPWFLQSSAFTTTAGAEKYPVDVIGFSGKARYLWLEDLSDPVRPHRTPIPLVSLDALNENYGGGDTAWGGDVSGHSVLPRAASVYYSLGAMSGHILEFAPIPQSAQQYRLTWEPSTVRPQAMGDVGFRLNQFDNYVAALTALRVMPHIGWRVLSPELTAARKAELRAALAYDIGSTNERRGYSYQFWVHKQSSQQMNKPAHIGWAESRW